MSKIKKILAPTDLSDLSKLGLRYALEVARDTSAEVIVYHAIDFSGEWTEKRSEVVAHPDLLQHSRRKLQAFLADNFADCINLVELRSMVEIGSPIQNIVEKAKEEGVDMIIMSTHGRTGLDHMILGSVTEKVVARAPCPVLVVPRSGRHLPDAKAA
ncbi:MAG: universal stress protein [Chloroflexota bacterium]